MQSNAYKLFLTPVPLVMKFLTVVESCFKPKLLCTYHC